MLYGTHIFILDLKSNGKYPSITLEGLSEFRSVSHAMNRFDTLNFEEEEEENAVRLPGCSELFCPYYPLTKTISGRLSGGSDFPAAAQSGIFALLQRTAGYQS
jgi:hypothetical protein